MTAPVVAGIKSILNLMGLAIFISAFGTWDGTAIVEIAIFVVGSIGIAAVLRSDVKGLKVEVGKLKKWQEDHDDEVSDYKQTHTELHGKLNESLTLLRQMADESGRRVTELEAERWRSLTQRNK